MYPSWKNKTDAQQHPVRYHAAMWEQEQKKNPRMAGRAFSPKQYGQLKQFMDVVGDLAPFVIQWISKAEHWWRVSQQVRAETNQYVVPDNPDLGFLVKHRNRILRIVRNELRNSMKPDDIQFCAAVDQRLMQQLKSLLLVYAAGTHELIARIEAAKSVEEMERLFIDIVEGT